MPRNVCVMVLICLAWTAELHAASLHIRIEDMKGQRLKDAVAYAMPQDPKALAGTKPGKAIVDQIDKEFEPFVSAVYAGSEVSFPNHDQIRHHVYSFSEAKTFEIPLYEGLPADPVVFNKPGIVVIGCNIHDWMKAYIFVSPTPFFGISDDKGQAAINALPAGKYNIQLWHPDLNGNFEDTLHSITVTSGAEIQTLTFQIQLKKGWKAWRAPALAPGSYK